MSHKTGLWVTGAIGLVIASLAMTALTAAVVNGVIQPMKTVRPLDLRCEQVPNNAACQNQSAVRTDAPRSTLILTDPLALPKADDTASRISRLP